MDSFRNGSRLHYPGASPVAASAVMRLVCCVWFSLVCGVFAADYQRTTNISSSTSHTRLGRDLTVNITATQAGVFNISFNGGTSFQQFNFSAGTSSKTFDLYTVGSSNNSVFFEPYTGLSEVSGPKTVNGGGTLPFIYKWTNSATPNATGNMVIPNKTLEISWATSAPYGPFGFEMEPAVINLTAGQLTNVTVGEVPKIYKEGVVLLENTTGREQKVMFGNEELILKPGYNAFPFYGEVDSNGFPKALAGMTGGNMSSTTSPDGNSVWGARFGLTPEGTGVWGSPPTMQAFAGSEGAVIKLPNASNPGVTDYVTLPAGLTKGSNVPLPGGMTAGSDDRLPTGVTPGSAGALPAGVISGGTANLPAGVSAGTVAGNGGTTSSGGTTGSNPGTVGGGTSGQGSDGNYVAGPSMAGMQGEGEKAGKAAAEALVKQVTDGLGEVKEKSDMMKNAGSTIRDMIIAPTSLGGHDRTWASFSVPIAKQTVNIEIPTYWLDLIRAILLWGVKIWFVWSVLKLFMK
jgi:hypothetical protein